MAVSLTKGLKSLNIVTFINYYLILIKICMKMHVLWRSYISDTFFASHVFKDEVSLQYKRYEKVDIDVLALKRFNCWFSFTLAYSRISHEYSSLFIIVINLIFMFSL